MELQVPHKWKHTICLRNIKQLLIFFHSSSGNHRYWYIHALNCKPFTIHIFELFSSCSRWVLMILTLTLLNWWLRVWIKEILEPCSEVSSFPNWINSLIDSYGLHTVCNKTGKSKILYRFSLMDEIWSWGLNLIKWCLSKFSHCGVDNIYRISWVNKVGINYCVCVYVL